VALLTKGKSRFGIEEYAINEGQKANFSLFNPDAKYIFSENNIHSKSKNSCFLGSELKGKAYGIIANNKIEL
jgi:dihydroorotase